MQSNIIGVGVDLVSIKRVNKIGKPDKILTNNEYDVWLSHKNENYKMRYLAMRWAAKEAVFKALPKLNLLTNAIKYIETIHDHNGKPYIQILPQIKSQLEEQYGNLFLDISLSDEGDMAIAFCIAFIKQETI